MNIYQKLIEVRKSCEYLKKDKTGYDFKFVSSSQTLGSLRKAMDDNALLLVPSVEEYEVRDHTTRKGDHKYFTILKMTFTWINADNPKENVKSGWTGQGLDSGEKGAGMAMTYAEKYFLLKFFNIATDKDDPDNFQGKPENKKKLLYSSSNAKTTKQDTTYKPAKDKPPSKEQTSETDKNNDIGRQVAAHRKAKEIWGDKGDEKLKEKLMADYGETSTKQITKEQLIEVIRYLNKERGV